MNKYTTVIKHEHKQGKSLDFYVFMTPFPYYMNMLNFSGRSCSYKNGTLLAEFQPGVLNPFVLICGCLLYHDTFICLNLIKVTYMYFPLIEILCSS